MTLLALVSWYTLASAWAYVQRIASTSGLVESWWHALLGLVLALHPLIWLSRGWLQVVVTGPLVLAAVLAWPMALRVSRRVARETAELGERPHPTPTHVARERARGADLQASCRDTLEIVQSWDRPASREAS